MKVQIYQIDMEQDLNRVKFCGLDETIKYSGKVDPSIYQKVYDGEVDCQDLNDVYKKFNLCPPKEHTGHSLSVSDIVGTKDGFYFCNSVGFDKIPFDPDQALQPEEKPEQSMGF